MSFRANKEIGILSTWIVLTLLLGACEPVQHGSRWFDEEMLTIGEYLNSNKEEYSRFYRLLDECEILSTLCGYNPYGDGYTLFLPTDEAIDQYIELNGKYGSFEELLEDRGMIGTLTRYHVINNGVHSDTFPFGALTDRTLTGERLTIGFYTDGNHPLYKVNNTIPIVRPNLEMTNGYIHVISGVLQKPEISGYDWLQQQEEYSILAHAMELSGIRDRLWLDTYTILAEHDSIYYRKGIFSTDDLIERVATPGIPYADPDNDLYRYTAYHILYGEFYLNDFNLGSDGYRTLSNEPVWIDVGFEIHINPGVDTLDIEISESGDTTVIDYIRLVWENCNILTGTGPVHSISDLLVDESMTD